MKTAAQMAANYQAAMASPAAKNNYTAGVQGVTNSPTAAAATPQALALYAQNTAAAAVQGGKMQTNLQAVSLQSWQQAAINKGAPRLSSGALAAAPKVTAHFQNWASTYQAASAAAAAIPKDGTPGTALAKVAAAMNVMLQKAGKQGV